MPALDLIFRLFLLIIPGTMVAIFVFGLIIMAKAEGHHARVAARAGFVAGIVVFILYAISQKQTPQTAQLALTQSPHFDISNLVTAIICTIITVATLWILSAFNVLARYVGFITLTLSAASLSAFDSYLFIVNFRETAIYLTLGFILGVLLFIMVRPEDGRRLWGGGGWPKS